MASFSSGFTGTENPLSEGGVWTNGPGSWTDVQKSSGVVTKAGAIPQCAFVNSPSFGANQYAQVVMTADGTGTYRNSGPAVRISSSTGDGYIVGWDSDLTVYKVYRSDGGSSFTQLGADISGPAAGDTLKLNVSGTTLEIFVNGSSKGTRTDSAYSSGQPGVWFYTDETSRTMDDFAADDGASAGANPPRVGQIPMAILCM